MQVKEKLVWAKLGIKIVVQEVCFFHRESWF